MADNNEAPPGLPRHEIDWKYGGMTVSRHGDWVRHSDAAAAISELRTEVERRGDVIRGHEATLTRLQGDLLRERLKKEAAEQLYKNEVEMSGAEVERLKALLHRVRVEVGHIELGETLSDEIDVAVDAARSAASGGTSNAR